MEKFHDCWKVSQAKNSSSNMEQRKEKSFSSREKFLKDGKVPQAPKSSSSLKKFLKRTAVANKNLFILLLIYYSPGKSSANVVHLLTQNIKSKTASLKSKFLDPTMHISKK